MDWLNLPNSRADSICRGQCGGFPEQEADDQVDPKPGHGVLEVKLPSASKLSKLGGEFRNDSGFGSSKWKISLVYLLFCSLRLLYLGPRNAVSLLG